MHEFQPVCRRGLFVLEHKFIVGQTEELMPSSLRAAAAGEYQIGRLLPASDVKSDSPRYSIKSIAEKHERVAPESDLTLSMALMRFQTRKDAETDGPDIPKPKPKF